MKNLFGMIVVVIAGIFAFILGKKNSVDKVLAENDKVKDKINELDKQVSTNSESLKNEESLRNQLREDMKKDQNEEDKLSSGDVADFFNKRK
jgi:uncharacterized protein (DUF3084 family)